MEKFKIGDEISPIISFDYLVKEKKYKVIDIDYENDPEIVDDKGEEDFYDASDFKLVSRNGKVIKEDLVRYMVYGTGCKNTSDLFVKEDEMSKEARCVALDDDWAGDIIGYKLTPIFKVEKKTILKKIGMDKKKTQK